MGRFIAIANQKGGVGKTTTAVNLAACMAAANRKALLIDLDPQGNATQGIGLDKDELDVSLYDVLINDVPVKQAIQPTEWANRIMVDALALFCWSKLEMTAKTAKFSLKITILWGKNIKSS